MKKMVLVIAVLAVSLTATSVASAAVLREFEGKVLSVDAAAKTFRLKDHDGRGVKTIKVTRGTRFEDIAGFGAIKPGLKRLEADVKRVDGAWVARKIELSGRDDDRDDDRGGDDDRHGGDDDRHGGDDD